MTNVVEFSSDLRHQRPKNSAASRAAVVEDLVALSTGVREAVEKTVDLTSPSLQQFEYAVQHLVDALGSLEAASAILTQDGDWVPF
jgi:hypothetical protein